MNKMNNKTNRNTPFFSLNKSIKEKLDNYTIEEYKNDVINHGLGKTWDDICSYILEFGDNKSLIKIDNFSEMYEIGLATQDKLNKKKSGQYFTPSDVSLLMSEWLDSCEGENVCDVACGTGRLILTYLDFIGKERAVKLLKDGKVYLYDHDKIALKICKTSLLYKYGQDLFDNINDIYCDFLDIDLVLPDNSKTIANPPYAMISKMGDNWNITDVIKESHEWYAAFMEKIIKQSKSTIIITPFSFISGSKFYNLRKVMCDKGYGFIVSFDNVPGNIFYGKKHGVFNSNTSNSVRAAITVVNSSKTKKGFNISPLIRFKNEERSRLFKTSVLENTLNDEYQLVTENDKTFKKISKSLNNVYNSLIEKSNYTFKDLVTTKENKYLLDIPNTCRYYTTASSKKLNRGGSITVYARDEDEYYFLYCFINSSFSYWWWRIFDGGITYPKGLLYSLPVPFNLLSNKEKEDFKQIALLMMSKEKEYIKTKVNAGNEQENIRFPKEFINDINKKILKVLKCKEKEEIFDQIHANSFFESSGGNNEFK